jgi:hypothetical protein
MTFREKLLALIAVSGVGVWGWWYFPKSTFAPKCTTDIVEVQKALDQSSQDSQGATGGDNLSKCAMYEHRLKVLESISAVTARCGPPEMTVYGAWPHPDAETAFYRRLVSVQCPRGTPTVR